MTIFGIDVSRHNGAIDWPAVYKGGIRFATIKCSEGTSAYTSDDTVARFRREFPRAKAAGLIVGAYHVVRSVSTVSQLDYFEAQLAAVGADPRDIIVQWDYEDWGYDFPSYARLKSCIDTFYARHRVRGVMYTGKWVWDRVTRDPANAAADLGVPLWDSNYGSNPNIDYRQAYPGHLSSRWTRSYGGWRPTILQYGSKCRVPGVVGGCDANAYLGTLEHFQDTFIARRAAPPSGAATSEPLDIAILAAGGGY